MAKQKMHTACRDCRMCTGRMLTGVGRQAGRRTADFATLGISAVARRKCKGCEHPMGEHQGQQAQAVIVQTPVQQHQPVQQPQLNYQPQPPAIAAGPAPGWYPDAADPRYERWWDGRGWTQHVQWRQAQPPT